LRLKAPSTADFPWYDEDNVQDEGNGRFVVSSYVDAENAFGAKIRVFFYCEVQYEGGDRWKLVDLTLFE
jgi:hypothetical protein